MISYAQNAEDVVLARAFGERTGGFFVDVGANDPTHDSVTRHFSDRGWVGINIEPQVACFETLQRVRTRDVNLNVGIGAVSGRLVFYFVPDAPAMSTFSPDQARLVRELGFQTEERKVEVRTLSDIFREYVGDRTVDFLKVDVEGLEGDVLDGFDWAHRRPRVVVVESSPEVAPWEEQLVKSGYQRTLWDGINLFFVRDEDAVELLPALSRPATIVLDRFDPWLYVEQLRQSSDRLAAVLRSYYVEILTHRGRSTNPETLAAVQALASVVSKRRDVIEHFAVPSVENLPALLSWASLADDRRGEPFTEELMPYCPMYARLAAARAPEELIFNALPRRLAARIKPMVPASIRSGLAKLRRPQ